MADNNFYSIVQGLQSTLKIKRSVFICALEHVKTIEDAKNFISRISKENKRATHNCWAYIVGEKAQVFHCSDAGEPSGTAGKPMLNALQQYQLTNIAVVVTRFYGGVKLGVRGLMDAYSQAIVQTIEPVCLIKQVQTILYSIDVIYEFNNQLLSQLNNFEVKIKDSIYTDRVHHTIEVDLDDGKNVERLLKEYQACGHIEFAPLL